LNVLHRCKGTLHHEISQPFARRAGPGLSKRLQEKLKTVGVSKLRKDLYGARAVDDPALLQGNLTEVRTRPTLKYLRQKVL